MTTLAAGVRQIEVQRLALRDELANVVRLGTTIVLAVWLYLASSLGDSAGGQNLLPYQALVPNRPAVEQRIFRELQEGLIEAEGARSATGTWPDIARLADDGIPPFAPDPTAKHATYRWHMLRENAYYINYLGIPDTPGARAWLVVVQETEPGVPPDQTFEDEEHHRLLDGTMVHVSTWNHDNGAQVAAKIVRLPQVEGWTQLYAVGPSPIVAPP